MKSSLPRDDNLLETLQKDLLAKNQTINDLRNEIFSLKSLHNTHEVENQQIKADLQRAREEISRLNERIHQEA